MQVRVQDLSGAGVDIVETFNDVKSAVARMYRLTEELADQEGYELEVVEVHAQWSVASRKWGRI